MFIMKPLRHIPFHRKTRAFFLGVVVRNLSHREPLSIGIMTRIIHLRLGSRALDGWIMCLVHHLMLQEKKGVTLKRSLWTEQE